MENGSKLVSHKLFLLLSFIIHISSSTTTTSTTITTPHPLVIKLIHRDSSLSPYYKPNSTIKDRARQAIKNSMSRFAYLKARTKTTSLITTDHDVRGCVLPEDGAAGFLVNFSIGEPPVPQLAFMDTGSNLLWVQCLPCSRCYKQFSPIFDPSKSSTYANLSCNSPYCVASINGACDSAAHCTYRIEYLDGTTTLGNLGTEKLMFGTSDESTTNVPSTVFGCGHDNYWLNAKSTGILGLGPKKTSLVSQLGSKFSYCTGNVFDPQYSHNQLILGDGAKVEGYSTPMAVYNGHYYLTLQGISVGEKRLDIKEETFKRSSSSSVIIDTGSTFSYLARGGFEPLSAEVQNLMAGVVLERVSNRDNPEQLCYRGMASRDLKGFPVVTFHFAGDADLVLDTSSMFYQNGPGEFCMAVLVSGDNESSVIGMMAQQYYNIAYDLAAMELSFQRIDCELLER